MEGHDPAAAAAYPAGLPCVFRWVDPACDALPTVTEYDRLRKTHATQLRSAYAVGIGLGLCGLGLGLWLNK